MCAIAGRDIVLAADDQLIALPCALHGYGSVGAKLMLGRSGVLNLQLKSKEETFPLVLPEQTTMICGAALSPRSNQIAWLLASATANEAFRVSLWCSGTDGSHWNVVGFELTVKPDTGFGEHLQKFSIDAPGDIQWLPDGKSLSFFYHGELYTVPVSVP